MEQHQQVGYPKLQKMEIMETILATLLAFLLVLGYACAEDCETCLPTHPQDQFCTADYGMFILCINLLFSIVSCTWYIVFFGLGPIQGVPINTIP